MRLKSLALLQHIFKMRSSSFGSDAGKQEVFKELIIESIYKEKIPAVRRQMCECAAQLAKNIVSGELILI